MERPHAKRFRALLAKRFLIRFHMSLILGAVMASAVLASKLLLLAGLTAVIVRYPLAAISAYLVFLGLIRIWVVYVTGRGNTTADFALGSSSPESADDDAAQFGGGSSGGAGASRNFDGDGSWVPDIDLSIDLDDGGWVLIVLGILLAVIFGAGGYLIYIAPELLPEVAMQVVLASTLKRASTKLAEQGWAMSVVKGTIVPFLLVLLMTVALGFAVHRTCPQATKLVDAMHCPAF